MVVRTDPNRCAFPKCPPPHPGATPSLLAATRFGSAELLLRRAVAVAVAAAAGRSGERFVEAAESIQMRGVVLGRVAGGV